MKKVVEYDNSIGFSWFKPIDLDTNNLVEGKSYAIEGGLADGTPVLFVTNSHDQLRKIMRLVWNTSSSGDFLGYAYTINDLGQKSVLTDKDMEKNYDLNMQRNLLERNQNRRKYVLVSLIDMKPVGELNKKGDRIVLARGKTWASVPRSTNGETTTPQQTKSGVGSILEGGRFKKVDF